MHGFKTKNYEENERQKTMKAYAFCKILHTPPPLLHLTYLKPEFPFFPSRGEFDPAMKHKRLKLSSLH